LQVKTWAYLVLSPKSFSFLSSPVANKHSTFSLTKISTFEVPAILKKFVLKQVTYAAAILKLSWQPGIVYVTSFHPT